MKETRPMLKTTPIAAGALIAAGTMSAPADAGSRFSLGFFGPHGSIVIGKQSDYHRDHGRDRHRDFCDHRHHNHYRQYLSPYAVKRLMRRQYGFYRVSDPYMKHGTYRLYAQHPRGYWVKVKVDPRSGRILRWRPI